MKVFEGINATLKRWLGRPRPESAPPVCILYVQDTAQVQTGSPQVLLEMLQRIDRTRFRPVVLCGEKGELTAALEKRGIPFRVIPIFSLAPRRVPFFLWSSLKMALMMLREEVLLVHMNASVWRSNTFFAAWLLRIPVIQHIHTLWPVTEIEESLFLPRVARFISCSRGAADLFARLTQYVPKLRVIYNGVDMKQAESARERLRVEFGLGPEAILVGTVGSLKPIKGQEIFLRMAHRVVASGAPVYFFVVGNDPMPGQPWLRKLEALVKELNLESRVYFTGFRKDNLDVIRSFDILVSASIEEAMGRTIVEAMAVGRAVVGAAVGGVPELIEDGVTGILVPTGEIEPLARAVSELASDRVLRERFGEAGRMSAEQRFSLDGFIKKVEGVYEEALQ